MTYHIVSRDFAAKANAPKNFLWAEFVLTDDKAHCKKLIDMLHYFKRGMTEKGFSELYIIELETGKCFQLAKVYDHMINKLKSIIAA